MWSVTCTDALQWASLKHYVNVNQPMKVLHDAAASSPLPWYLSCSGDMIGQSGLVAMPTTGALTSNVVYLCPPAEPYGQWVAPTMGQLIPAVSSGSNGQYPVTWAWPHLANYLMTSSCLSDRTQDVCLATPAAHRLVTTIQEHIYIFQVNGCTITFSNCNFITIMLYKRCY